MRRRAFLALTGAAAAWPFCAHGQQPGLPTLGVLLVGNREPFLTEFTAGLRQHGYVEGQNLQLVLRSAEGKLAALAGLAAELVGMNVDVIVASETPAVRAARQATNRIPIVMAPSGDPVGTGLVASLARPGGNVTGLSAATAELAGKSLDLLREVLPSMRRVAALADPANAFTKPFLTHIHLVARGLGLAVDEVMVTGPADLETAFAEMANRRAEAVVVQPTLPRTPIMPLLQRFRLPSVSGNRAFAEAGGLMSYAGSLADRYRNAAPYVDRILKGARPADLPVQQPSRFELVINARSARALGLEIPSTLLARADEVIE